ncbi:MAG: GntR family transcriptional regulator [Lactovum sp.]
MTKYEIIADNLRQKIRTGEFEKNSALPFEYELCKHYNCSKQTMKKALELLVFEGLIYRQRGKGTFVKSTFELDSYEKSDSYIGGQTRNVGKEETISNQLILFEIINPTAEVAEILAVAKDSFIYHFKKLRTVDDKKNVIIESFVPITTIPGLTKKDVTGSFFNYVENQLNLKIKSVHKKITVGKADKDCQTYMGLQEHDPIAIVEGIHFLSSGDIFEYSISQHNPSSFVFHSIYTKV